jgi:hypothetical protein
MDERNPHAGFDPAPAESPAKDLGFLVWDKVERGRLFILPDPKGWAGPAAGHQCVVCEQRIHDPSECEVLGPDGPVFAHLACHTAWSLESQVRRQRPASTTTL